MFSGGLVWMKVIGVGAAGVDGALNWSKPPGAGVIPIPPMAPVGAGATGAPLKSPNPSPGDETAGDAPKASKPPPDTGIVAAGGVGVALKGSKAAGAGAGTGTGAGAPKGTGAGAPKESPGVGGATLGISLGGLGGFGGLGGLLLKESKGAGGGGGACAEDPNGSNDALPPPPPPPPLLLPKGSKPFEPPEAGAPKGSPKLLELP